MANLLRRLEATAAPAAGVSAPRTRWPRFDGRATLTLTYGGTVIRLKSKGVGYLAHLLRHPGNEFHALDLMGDDGDAGVSPVGLARVADSDAGEVLDAEARAAYRAAWSISGTSSRSAPVQRPRARGRLRSRDGSADRRAVAGMGIGSRATDGSTPNALA
jgi:hypothetical protein